MPQFLKGNYIDLVILLILFYYATEAFRHGFWIILSDFISFFGSLVLSLRFYKVISEFLKVNFSLNLSVANAIGYLVAAIIFESLLGFIAGFLIHKLPEKLKKHRLNNLLGIIPGIGEGVVIAAFLLTLIMALPIKPQVKVDINNSKIGSLIIEKTSLFEKNINEVFGGVINDSLTYLTSNSESTDSVTLDVKTFDLKTDDEAEREMLNLINKERNKLAIPELVVDSSLTHIAREHATDMWKRKYFSHVSPEGNDVADRLRTNGLNYTFAGENLALAPTVTTAHTGLMNSKGHRENILDQKFKKVGVGVIDNGVYGKMFVEVFTD
jgi:uncharacterized protein YkwD